MAHAHSIGPEFGAGSFLQDPPCEPLPYRDASFRRTSDEALARAQAELAHSARMGAMGMMAGALAHELAQPLTSAGSAIDASLMLLSRNGAADLESARDALALARGSVDRANDLLRRVRAFVAKGTPCCEVHKLETIVTDAAVLMFPEARLAGVEIRVELDRRAKWVEADAIQIQQVLTTLVKNAIEAMADAAARRVTISTAAFPTDEVEIRVEDSGPGLKLPPEALFARTGNDGKAESGLGLTICRTIVQAHGGRMRADRSPAGGASFRFTLPTALAPEQAHLPHRTQVEA